LKNGIKYSERFLKAQRVNLGIDKPEFNGNVADHKQEGMFEGEQWKVVKEENKKQKKRQYTHWKKEMKHEEMVKAAFNDPNAKWRKAIKYRHILGGSLDVTYSLNRETFEVQLNFTPDMSQKEKMNVLRLIKIWAEKFEKTQYLPDYGTQIMKAEI
jgi:hypothetical protein